MEHEPDPFGRVLTWLGVPVTPRIRGQLEAYALWLATEALEAGGIGPGEVERIWDRHIADSLSFAAGFGEPFPHTIVDVGSGVGLPGIPIAVAYPRARVVLLDRSGRRTQLSRRAVRILQLDNVTVRQDDVMRWNERVPGLTFRASFGVDDAFEVSRRLLEPGGTGIFGLSRTTPPDARHLTERADTYGISAGVIEIPSDVLDSPAWLLRMTPQ